MAGKSVIHAVQHLNLDQNKVVRSSKQDLVNGARSWDLQEPQDVSLRPPPAVPSQQQQQPAGI